MTQTNHLYDIYVEDKVYSVAFSLIDAHEQVKKLQDKYPGTPVWFGVTPAANSIPDEWYNEEPKEQRVVKGFVDGLDPNAPIVTNEKGGKQSDSPYACELIPPLAILEVAKVLKQGAKKYDAWNWKKIPLDQHISHVLGHLFAHNAGDTSDEHLSHAATRLLFALEVYLEMVNKGEW